MNMRLLAQTGIVALSVAVGGAVPQAYAVDLAPTDQRVVFDTGGSGAFDYSSSPLFTGNGLIGPGANGDASSLFWFDLSSFIPANSYDADLTITWVDEGDSAVNLGSLKAAWVAGDADTAYLVAGDQQFTGSFGPSNTSPYTVDVTTLVAAWISGADNFGFSLISGGSIWKNLSAELSVVEVSSPVPEPMSVGLLATAAVVLGARRRR